MMMQLIKPLQSLVTLTTLSVGLAASTVANAATKAESLNLGNLTSRLERDSYQGAKRLLAEQPHERIVQHNQREIVDCLQAVGPWAYDSQGNVLSQTYHPLTTEESPWGTFFTNETIHQFRTDCRQKNKPSTPPNLLRRRIQEH